jgi:hypothetical protein
MLSYFSNNIMEENKMRKLFGVTLAVMLILVAVLYSGQASPAAASEQTILSFTTMVGVPSTFTGTQYPIRGINGGGLPWMLTSATGVLSSGGRLELQVKGLVLAAGANVGKNPIANFRATVSCLTTGGAISNVSTGLFPATTGSALTGGGNANVVATLSLPKPCIAPIIFVTSPTGAWFAATGR